MSSEQNTDEHSITLSRELLHQSRRVKSESPPLMRNEMSEAVTDGSQEIPLPTALTEETEEIRVLHVDDSPDIVELTQTFLERNDESFSVHGETSAVEALQTLRERNVDCIISDYDMPNTDGLELLEIVREQYPDLPFILYTAKGSEEVASEAISAGVTEYMQKETSPEQYEVLANRVRNAVERHRATERFWDALALYRRLAEQDLAGVFVVQDEELRYVNNRFAEIFDYSREELLGSDLRILFDDSTADCEISEFLAAAGGERRNYNGKLTCVRRGSEPVEIELYAGSIHHEGNTGCVGLVWLRS